MFCRPLSELGGGVQRERVAQRTKTGDGPLGRLSDIALVTETFPRVRVGQVNFDDRHLDRFDRVVDCNRRVRESACVQEDRLCAHRLRFVQPLTVPVSLEVYARNRMPYADAGFAYDVDRANDFLPLGVAPAATPVPTLGARWQVLLGLAFVGVGLMKLTTPVEQLRAAQQQNRKAKA